MRIRTRALGAVLALLFLAGACSVDEERSPGPTALPAPLPEITLTGLAGHPDVDLAEVRGPAVVNVWASWCGPCRDEMPILEEFSQKYEGQIDLLGIDYQDPHTDEVEKFLAETEVTYPLVSDVDGDISARGPFPYMQGLPFMAFVDADGQVVGRQFVIIEDLAELEALTTEYLGVPASTSEEEETQ